MNNPSGCTVALGSTQPLTEMSTRNISLGGKGGRCVGLTLPPSCANCHEIWQPQLSGTFCNRLALPLPLLNCVPFQPVQDFRRRCWNGVLVGNREGGMLMTTQLGTAQT